MNRKLALETTGATVGAASVTVLGPNPNRHSLTLSGDSAQRVTFNLKDSAVLDQGLTLPAGSRPFTLCYDDFG